MDLRVDLRMNGDRRIAGIMKGYDQYMNIVLDEAIEISNSKGKGDKKDANRSLGMIVIRGASVCLIIESGISCCRRSVWMCILAYCISLRNSSTFFPNSFTMLLFACLAWFINRSNLSMSLIAEPTSDPGPLPLLTLPEPLILARFIMFVD